MKKLLITDHLYGRLKTIAVEQNERIQVINSPSLGTGTGVAIDGRDGSGSASNRALFAAAESGDMAEYRKIRGKQKDR